MRKVFFLVVALAAMSVSAQTARQFTVNITPDGESTLQAFLPEQPTGRAVVACPGGGYTHLAMAHEGTDWAPYFNQQGIALFVLKYRMPKGDREIPMSDARHAILMVRDSAEVWSVNPYDVGIMGSSAGGHLASTISTHEEFASRPNFSILFYPVISMNERETHKGSCQNFLGEKGQKDEKLVKAYSNQFAVRRHLVPPTIILTANDDRVVHPVTNGIAYYSAMRRAGNDCALYVYPSGGHGFGFRSSWTFHNQMLGDLTAWLKTLKAPRKDAIRVACIGNSITDGDGIDMAESRGYPAQLQQLLGDGYHVKNYGVSARTMLNNGDHPYMQELAWRDALAFKPDIVVIKLGTNDSKDYIWNDHKGEFETDYQSMIDQLKPMVPVLDKKGRPTKKMRRADNPQILLCTPIKAFSDRWGISDSVIVNEVIPAIQHVAQKNGLEVIDLHAVVTDRAEMTSDMIHPNEKGAGKMAEAIRNRIKK